MKTSAGLLAAVLLTSTATAVAGSLNFVSRPGPLVLRAELNVGMQDSCGAREMPHLVEHLAVSSTTYGSTPGHLIEAAGLHGVTFSAVTRQDFTEFTVAGPSAEADFMVQLLEAVLARKELNKADLTREVEAIRLELGRENGFRSSDQGFEAFAARFFPLAPAPCKGSEKRVDHYSFDDVQAFFDKYYVGHNVSLYGVGPVEPPAFARLAKLIEIERGPGAPVARQLAGETGNPAWFPQSPAGGAALEILMPIPGRKSLPPAVAQRITELLRQALLTAVREQPISYNPRAVLHQSNTAGWISLTVPADRALSGSESANLTAIVQEKLQTLSTNPSLAIPDIDSISADSLVISLGGKSLNFQTDSVVYAVQVASAGLISIALEQPKMALLRDYLWLRVALLSFAALMTIWHFRRGIRRKWRELRGAAPC